MRNNLFFRNKTSVGQILSTNWELKRASFLDYYLEQSAGIDLAHIGIMDDVHVCFDIPGNFTVNEKGASVKKIATSGNEKSSFTVILCVTADGTKLKPMVIFKKKL